jgi:DNA-binding NtrC family response regulator
MPDMTGFDVLQKAKSISSDIYVLLMTGHSSINESVKAIKSGAYDYIPKPVDTDLLMYKLELIEENKSLKERAAAINSDNNFIFASPKMEQLITQAERAAKSDTNILITGESGTGKEVLAKHIHKNSPRTGKNFAAINCSNFQPTLFESELFGHKKGAFTGAERDRKGIIQSAYGGTLFLDEIGEMPLDIQPKFLRFLEDQTFHPIGSDTPEIADVRIVAATNKDLSSMVESGDFREDLFYRLNVFNIDIPPLRERKEDIIPLAEYFIAKYKNINPKVKGINSSGSECLTSYFFPGNVRELSNIIERAMILEHEDYLSCQSLNIGFTASCKSQSLDSVIKQHILETLDKTGGNKQKAAEILEVDTSTVYRKLKEYGIS